jgi:drug/metabolite transporter (DMT)-like permease
MVLSAFAFSLMTVFVKLAGVRLPWQELVVARAAVTLVLSYAWLRAARVAPFGTHRALLILRGGFGFLGLSSVYYAVTHLPLAEATVIQYLYPPLTVALASLLLREPMERVVLVSMTLGVAGLVLVAQPAALFGSVAAPLDPSGLIAAFLGAFFSACAYVTVRTLGKGEHPLVIVFYFPLVALPASLVTIGAHAVWPKGVEWCWLLLLGLCTQIGQVAVTRGFASAAAGRMAAYSYIQVLFAALWGALIFHEQPKPLSLAGAALIIAGALFNLRTARASAAAASLLEDRAP